MNFQESGAEVSQKIYSKCGKPTTLTRPKRKADYKDSTDNPNMEIKVEPKVPGKKKNKKVTEPVDSKTVLEKIIGDIKQVSRNCNYNCYNCVQIEINKLKHQIKKHYIVCYVILKISMDALIF